MFDRIKFAIQRVTRFHRQGNKPNITVFSTARSGSSWLMELITTQHGMKYVDEPLHPRNLQLSQTLTSYQGPPWASLLPNDTRKEELQHYFMEIENNRLHIGEPRILSSFYRPITNRIVYKLLRAKDLANWLEKIFGWQIVYLVRHPLAANISRKSFPRLELFLNNDEFISTYLSKEQKTYAKNICETGTVLQQGVLDWCLQNLPPIHYLDRRGWLCMHYEDLVSSPQKQVGIVSNALQLVQPNLMLTQIAKASGSTIQSDHQTQSVLAGRFRGNKEKFLLSKWRSKLSEKEEFQAFEVLDVFGIDLYSQGEDLPTRRLESINNIN